MGEYQNKINGIWKWSFIIVFLVTLILGGIYNNLIIQRYAVTFENIGLIIFGSLISGFVVSLVFKWFAIGYFEPRKHDKMREPKTKRGQITITNGWVILAIVISFILAIIYWYYKYGGK